MNYCMKSHPTVYDGVLFRSRLEARWAAFFDIIGWQWEYEPIDLEGWTPDFRVTFPCGHSECNGCHVLLVEIKPYYCIDEFKGHECMEYPFGIKMIRDGEEVGRIPASASAAFGANPNISYWEMCHGAGGGIYTIKQWVHIDIDYTWKDAGAIVQYLVKNNV